MHGATSNFRVQSQGGKALVLGTVAPGTGHVKGTVTVFARAVGKQGAFKKVATERSGDEPGQLRDLGSARRGQLERSRSKFQDPKQGRGRDLEHGQGHDRAQAGVEREPELGQDPEGRVHADRGGTAAPAESGAKIELLGLNTAPGRAGPLHEFGTTKLGAGKTKFTLHAKVKSGTRWVLQLEYIRPGQAPSFSGLRTVDIQ